MVQNSQVPAIAKRQRPLPGLPQDHQPRRFRYIGRNRPISAAPASGAEADASRDNPIPYLNGIEVGTGLAYAFERKIYLAKADMKPGV